MKNISIKLKIDAKKYEAAQQFMEEKGLDIEKAIDFFFAYSTTQMSQDYLCSVFGSKMEGLVSNLATRISKGNFRSAVEMDMHTRMLATVVQLSKSDYDKMRVKAINEVRQMNGSIDILEAVNESEDEI